MVKGGVWPPLPSAMDERRTMDNWTYGNYIWLIMAVCAQLLDTVSTSAALRIPGIVECDPILGTHPSVDLLLFEKIIMVLVMCTLAGLLTMPVLRNRLFSVIFFLGASAFCWNLYIISEVLW